jgi:hypothetical protein
MKPIPEHITPIKVDGAKLVVWHTQLDVAGYESPTGDILAIKGQAVSDELRDIVPIGTQISSLARYDLTEAKLIVKRRYNIDL